MSETKEQVKHTPGSWFVDPVRLVENVADSKILLRDESTQQWIAIAVTDGEVSEETMHANARLIAAAPELLEACKKLDVTPVVRAIKEGFDYAPGHSDLDDEQPIYVSMTLGDYRRANRLLYGLEKSA